MRFDRLTLLAIGTLGASFFAVGSARADDAPPPIAADAKPEEGKSEDAPKAEKHHHHKDKDGDGDDDDDKGSKHKGEDHVRFRGGVSAGGGAMIFTTAALGSTGSVALGTGGMDFRLGAQINNLIGVYAQPHFGIYGGSPGVGGFAGGVAAIDFTFLDRIFVGVGGGGVLLQSIGAGEAMLRVGGYPAMGRGADGVRRKGLMLGLDLRIFIAPAGGTTLVAPSPTFNIGYEAF